MINKIFKRFNYPEKVEYFTKRNITGIGNWDIFDEDNLEMKLLSIRDRYPNKGLLPFAYNQDNDFVACFKEECEDKVFIIYDYVDDGKEQGEIFDSLKDFTRYVLCSYIEERMLDDVSDNETFEEVNELFKNTMEFAKIVQNVEFYDNNYNRYSYDTKENYIEISILKKSDFNIKEGFSRIFKEQLFFNEEWDRKEEKEYKSKGWEKYIEEYWIPEYFLSNDRFDTLSVNVKPYKEEILALINKEDENKKKLIIDNEEFEEAEAVVYNRYFNDSSTFINSKNYYINFEIIYRN